MSRDVLGIKSDDYLSMRNSKGFQGPGFHGWKSEGGGILIKGKKYKCMYDYIMSRWHIRKGFSNGGDVTKHPLFPVVVDAVWAYCEYDVIKSFLKDTGNKKLVMMDEDKFLGSGSKDSLDAGGMNAFGAALEKVREEVVVLRWQDMFS